MFKLFNFFSTLNEGLDPRFKILRSILFRGESFVLKYKQKSDDLHAFHQFPFTYPSFPRHLRVRRHREEQCFGLPGVRKHSITQRFCICAHISRCTCTLAGKNEITTNINRRKLVLYRISQRRALFSASKSLNPHVDMDSSFLCCMPHNVHISTRTNINNDIRIDTILIYLR